MQKNEIKELISKQKKYFASGNSRNIVFRLKALRKLKEVVLRKEEEILNALSEDLGKPHMESYASELGIIINEINYAIRNLKRWMKPERAKSTLLISPARNYIIKEPYGVVLIIGPWNYPFHLTLVPLVGAIAAGNCCIIKPSEISIASSKVVKELIQETFDEKYIAVVEGNVETSNYLLEESFDKIFFTGSPTVGKIIMEKAAKHLTPVTLELGGKSPCVVDKDIDIEVTAKRILWGKFFNAGQTCIAPDYLIVNKKIKEALYASFRKWLKEFFTEHPEKSPDLSRIVNLRHFQRLNDYLKQGKIIAGGEAYKEQLFISPTIMEVSDMNLPVMQEEIFGPILPVIEYTKPEEIEKIINYNPNPLGFYIFSRNRKLVKHFIQRIPFGGGCINDTIMHVQNHHMPFGGRGSSGIGNYHGVYSFDTFSHRKSIVQKEFTFDVKLKYPPYKDKHRLLKKYLLK